MLSLQDLMKWKSSQKQCFSTFASHSWLWILPTPTIQLNPQPKYPQIPPKFCFFFLCQKQKTKTQRERERKKNLTLLSLLLPQLPANTKPTSKMEPDNTDLMNPIS